MLCLTNDQSLATHDTRLQNYPPPDFLGKLAYFPEDGAAADCEDPDPEVGIVFFLSVAVEKDRNVQCQGHGICSCDSSVVPKERFLKGDVLDGENINVLLNMEQGSGVTWKVSQARPVKPLKYPRCFDAAPGYKELSETAVTSCLP